MNRKITIIGGIVLLVAVSVGLIFWSRSNLSKNVQSIPAPTEPSQVPGTLPVEAPSASAPSQNPTSSQPSQQVRDRTVRVEEKNNSGEIQASYKNYINQNINDFPTYVQDGISADYPVNDNSGKKVDLQTFLSAVDANINPQVKNLVGANYYGMFYCIDQKKQKEYGIAFDVADESKDLHAQGVETRDAMKKWEPYILKDLHAILFPQDNFSQAALDQVLTFKDGEFRYANIDVVGQQKSIDYTVETDENSYVNRIYITTSQNCLRKALDYLFDF